MPSKFCKLLFATDQKYFRKDLLGRAGGLAVVFGAGASNQTTLTSDGGQFQALSSAYSSAPAPLP
jgi:hypothetical protein